MKQNSKPQNKIKVGIIGEHPQNDSNALKIILNNCKKENVEFKVLLKNERGGQLLHEKYLNRVAKEVIAEQLDFLIVIKDSDALISQQEEIKEIDKWYAKVNEKAQNKGIFFLVVKMFEALFLSDIDAVNKLYGVKISYAKNPTFEDRPTDFLKDKTQKSKRGKYEKNDSTLIAEKLSFQKIYQNHTGKRSFQIFADELKEKEIIEF